MLLSAKLRLDTTAFTGPLKEAAAASRGTAAALNSMDPAATERARDALRRLREDADSGRIALSGVSDGLDDVADSAARAETGIGRAAKQTELLGMKTAQIRQLSLALGGMALNVGGAALEAAGQDRAAGYLQAAGSQALQGAMVGGMAFGPKGAAIGAVIGGASGVTTHFLKDMKRDREEAEKLDQAFRELRIGGEAAMRNIADIGKSDQAEATLRGLTNEFLILQARFADGLELGEVPFRKLQELQTAMAAASQRAAVLRESEARSAREEAISESRGALAGFDVAQADAESRRVFDSIFAGAKTSADKAALVSTRIAEFGAAAADLRERLLMPATQADPEKFQAAFARMATMANEVARLKGITIKPDSPSKTQPAPRAPAFASDQLARIGIFTSGGGKMESLAERSARIAERSERHLSKLANRAAAPRGAVWS
jgi:hypothetical protein